MPDERTTPVIPESFWEKLQGVYSAEGFVSEYQEEAAAHRALLPRIIAALPHNYELDEPVHMGGAGIICRLKDIHLSALQEPSSGNVFRALKWPRPLRGQMDPLLNRSLVKELRTLAAISHPNVIKLYFAASVEEGAREIPFYVMEYIEGAMTARKYVMRSGLRFEDFLRLLKDIVSGVACLFAHRLVHNGNARCSTEGTQEISSDAPLWTWGM